MYEFVNRRRECADPTAHFLVSKLEFATVIECLWSAVYVTDVACSAFYM